MTVEQIAARSPPVALIDVLDHLLAPLVLEIDVDVGRLAAVLRNEAGEQQLDFGGIDLGDAEAKAHDAVGRRAASLAEDRLWQIARKGDHVMHGQEVARVIELGDQCQFLGEVSFTSSGRPAGYLSLG